ASAEHVGSLLEMELGTGEQRVPAVGGALAAVEHRGGVGSDHAVDLVADSGGRIRKRAAAIDHRLSEVDAGQQGAGAEPGTVARPAGDGGRVVEYLPHPDAGGDGLGGEVGLTERS